MLFAYRNHHQHTGGSTTGSRGAAAGSQRARGKAMRFKPRTDADHDRTYGRRWKEFRLAWLHGHDTDRERWMDAILARMYCAQCGRGPLPESAPVDHVRAHGGDPSLLWAFSNLQRLCVKCHNRKTMLTKLRGSK
jgi:5-methylcytosine-specific restriction endonuclease McrA